jgi:hypothetical protein
MYTLTHSLGLFQPGYVRMTVSPVTHYQISRHKDTPFWERSRWFRKVKREERKFRPTPMDDAILSQPNSITQPQVESEKVIGLSTKRDIWHNEK